MSIDSNHRRTANGRVLWPTILALLLAAIAAWMVFGRPLEWWPLAGVVASIAGILLALIARRTGRRSGEEYDGRLALLAFLICAGVCIYTAPIAIALATAS